MIAGRKLLMAPSPVTVERTQDPTSAEGTPDARRIYLVNAC
jgi:hypothetical protein